MNYVFEAMLVVGALFAVLIFTLNTGILEPQQVADFLESLEGR